MKIEITNVSISYSEGKLAGVQAYYNGYNTDRTININGYLPLTNEAYVGNEAIDKLTVLVKENLISALSETDDAIID